jgi:hypothetical protein
VLLVQVNFIQILFSLLLIFGAMKKILQLSFIVCFVVLAITSCKKDSFITSGDASLRLSEDTLHFDTVFTVLGSTTQYLKIFNINDQKLKISSLKLMGTNSFFKINVDGIPGIEFNNLELEANDSMYLFATVKIDPNAANLPFLIRDSIKIEFNGNTKWLQLEAYGKNARFMNNIIITKDTTIKNDSPIVILGGLTVNQNATLTVEKGTQLFIHPSAAIKINGTLNAIGDTNAKIVFQGIRIDDPYINYPGGWSSIYFSPTSKNNFLKYCVLKNAYQGVVLDAPATNSSPKLVMEACILDNIYDRAVLAVNSSCTATNCLISNVGYGLYVVSGGNYNFNHCTFVSISNYYISHKEALITLANCDADKKNRSTLKTTITNSIIYGEGGFRDDEIEYLKADGTDFNVTMSHILYKQKTALPTTLFGISSALPTNSNPLFDSIDISKRYYNFRLQSTSLCINAAASSVTNDLDGKSRPLGGAADLGCYEKQ